MDQTHITEDELHAALDSYRWALADARTELGADASRADVIARGRKMLGDDEPDHHALLLRLAESDSGDPIWNLEEEVVDDELSGDIASEKSESD
ncbi:hypothetical protein K8P10_002785 [Leucobacter sp. Psy1]|uniref:hypothetical protein n=1 Tax=Leucobacter sp. Psy1 TaxID=2875729 RepID=UPI001CD43C27|nr:hypothetical protein [Leucobacter sp. Psy1]UBH07274.1 hypothetical protein K8P10_002785 [Leucobacter sp. Psy1]